GVPQGSVLRADRAFVHLNPAVCTTDAAAFEAAAKAALRADDGAEDGSRGGIAPLVAAADLYGGELLPGYYEDWNLTERDRLRESYLEVLGRLIERLERGGDLSRALDYALKAVSADPQREPAHGDLIRLYAAMGDTAAALRQYGALEAMLAEDFDARPSPSIRALIEEIRQRPLARPAVATPPEQPARLERTPLTAGTVTALAADGIDVEDVET